MSRFTSTISRRFAITLAGALGASAIALAAPAFADDNAPVTYAAVVLDQATIDANAITAEATLVAQEAADYAAAVTLDNALVAAINYDPTYIPDVSWEATVQYSVNALQDPITGANIDPSTTSYQADTAWQTAQTN